MNFTSFIHGLLGRAYKYDVVKNFKDRLLPFRHALFGSQGFYRALEVAEELSRRRGRGEFRTIFDIGASVGDKAHVFFLNYPHSEVYCFEPFPPSFTRLVRRTKRFGSRAHCFNFGFYNTSGTRNFYPEKDPGGSSLIPFGVQARTDIRKEKVTHVEVRKLDDFFHERRLQRIDFMKIDVEGVEKEVIEGGREALRHTDNVFVEISPLRKGPRSHDYIDVFELLHGLGFSLVGVHEDFLFSRLIP